MSAQESESAHVEIRKRTNGHEFDTNAIVMVQGGENLQPAVKGIDGRGETNEKKRSIEESSLFEDWCQSETVLLSESSVGGTCERGSLLKNDNPLYIEYTGTMDQQRTGE